MMEPADKKTFRKPLPLLCKNYNKRFGCSRESCEDLHVCYYYLCRSCTNRACTRAHTLDDPRNLVILAELGYFGREGLKRAYHDMRRKMRGVTVSLCLSYNAGVCGSPECLRLHVCHRHVTGGCPLPDCDLSHSVTGGPHNSRVLSDADLADQPVSDILRILSEELTLRPFKPAICHRFHNKAVGCEGRCLRLHCCPHFLRGSCWYNDRCFKKHNLQDPHDERVLRFFGYTEQQVLAAFPSWYGSGVNQGGVIEERFATKATLVEGNEASASEGRKSEGCANPEDTPCQMNAEIGAAEDHPDRPVEVQKLIDYLSHYRQRKARRDQRQKERQALLQQVLERKAREERGVKHTGRELRGSEQQQEEEAGGEDRGEKVLGAQSKCGVCRGVLAKPVVLNCSHAFCQACVESTRLPNKSCPLCFQPIYVQTRGSILDNLDPSQTTGRQTLE